jgi:hypothetical protein
MPFNSKIIKNRFLYKSWNIFTKELLLRGYEIFNILLAFFTSKLCTALITAFKWCWDGSSCVRKTITESYFSLWEIIIPTYN